MRLRSQSILLRARFYFLFSLGLFTMASVGGAQGLSSSDLSRLRSVGGVELSPDGRRIAYTVTMRDRPGRPYGQLWIMDLAGQKSVRVGGEKDSGGGPLWSPDGKWFAFQGHQGEKGGLFVAHPDGSDVTFLASLSGTNSPCQAQAEISPGRPTASRSHSSPRLPAQRLRKPPAIPW
jgi:dipeptidyl aminopeptidase/acylaminoacyl peptidase